MTTDDAYPPIYGDRLSAEDLLASPRGRSLVFGLALKGRDDEFDAEAQPLTADARALVEVRSVVIAASSQIDTAQGVAVSADVAALLRHITPVTPTLEEVENEMAEVISRAMYWQPPLGDDQIASDPVMREALRPFAEVLIDTGLFDSWSLPINPNDQWVLAWDDEDHRGALPAVFDRETGPVDSATEDRGIDPTDLFPTNTGDGIQPPWGLSEWLADVLTTETRYRHDFVENAFEDVSGAW